MHCGWGSRSPSTAPSPPLRAHWLQESAGGLEQGTESKPSFQHVELVWPICVASWLTLHGCHELRQPPSSSSNAHFFMNLHGLKKKQKQTVLYPLLYELKLTGIIVKGRGCGVERSELSMSCVALVIHSDIYSLIFWNPTTHSSVREEFPSHTKVNNLAIQTVGLLYQD